MIDLSLSVYSNYTTKLGYGQEVILPILGFY